jgi:hypothetical protein
MGGSYYKNGIKKDPKKKVLNGKLDKQEQWENQEQDRRTLSRGTYHKS